MVYVMWFMRMFIYVSLKCPFIIKIAFKKCLKNSPGFTHNQHQTEYGINFQSAFNRILE